MFRFFDTVVGLGAQNSGRDGIFGTNNRSLVGTLSGDTGGYQTTEGLSITGISQPAGGTSLRWITTQTFPSASFLRNPGDSKRTNPYLLHPQDNLIFGWQLPTDLNIDQYFGPFGSLPTINNEGPKLTFAQAPAKIILYGSYIREGKEHHDTLNQLLTSNTIHEDIE